MEEGRALVSVNLETYRTARGWSQTDLAVAAGVEKSTVSRIESGKRPNPRGSTLVKLATALDLKSTDLTGETSSMPSSIVYQGVTQVPVIRYLHASASPSWRDTGERIAIPETLAGMAKTLLAGVVTGDCMAPEVESGDWVIWDSAKRNPQDGDMVVVSHDGDVLVKRAYRDEKGAFLLVSNDGQRIRPNGAVLEGVAVSIIKKPKRRPLQAG